MPADTTGSMIMGYAIILGILAFYGVTLYLRTKRAKGNQQEE